MFSLEKDELTKLRKDIEEKSAISKDTFKDAPEEDRDFLQLFSFICLLAFDTYMKKTLIEKLIDSLEFLNHFSLTAYADSIKVREVFMKKNWKKITAALLTATMLLGTGCGKKEKTEEAAKVTLNEVAHSIFYAPQYAAIELGYFKEEGIDLTLVTGFGADKTMTAVVSGEADIGFMGSEASIYAYAQGASDYVINFAQLTQRAGNFLVAREKMPDFSWDDLKGKTVLGGRKGGCQGTM